MPARHRFNRRITSFSCWCPVLVPPFSGGTRPVKFPHPLARSAIRVGGTLVFCERCLPMMLSLRKGNVDLATAHVGAGALTRPYVSRGEIDVAFPQRQHHRQAPLTKHEGAAHPYRAPRERVGEFDRPCPSRERRHKDRAPTTERSDSAVETVPSWHAFQPLRCNLRYNIRQGSNAVNRDADLIAVRQCECVPRNDAGAGQQKTSARKRVVAIKIVHQHLRVAFEFIESSSAAERRFAAA